MGAGGILYRDYDWVGVTFATNEHTGDNTVLGCGQLVLAMDGDSSTSIAVSVQLLMEREVTEFLPLLGCDAKEVMIID